MMRRLTALTVAVLLMLGLTAGCSSGNDRASVERLMALEPESAAAFEAIRVVSQKAAISGVTEATFADFSATAKTMRTLADRYGQAKVTTKSKPIAEGLQTAVRLAADRLDAAVTALRDGKQDLYWTTMAGTADALESFMKYQTELEQLAAKIGP